jgi:hypothetical protein
MSLQNYTGFLYFVQPSELQIQENTTFRKLDMFPSSVEGGGYLVCWILQKELTSITGQPMKLKLIYDRQSVGQSVLLSGARLGPATQCGFVIL